MLLISEARGISKEMDKKQTVMQAIVLWIIGGLSALLFMYCLRGAQRGDIDVGRIARSPYVEGHLHGDPAWLVTACAFAFSASLLAIAVVASLSVFPHLNKRKWPGGIALVSLLIAACSGVAGAVMTYMGAAPMP